MRRDHAELWDKIRSFSIDEPKTALMFHHRLARENAWSEAFARRVVDEYKKFVFLMAAAGHPVTPSEHVDHAWHLHLCYTRSYWDDLCGRVVGRPLHHGPTRGGASEDAKYHDWYARTLESYRALLGEEPPADIWPAPECRFGHDTRWVRVHRAGVWIVPKRAAKIAATIAGAVGVLGAVSAAGVGCASLLVGQSSGSSGSGPVVLLVFLITLVVGLIAWGGISMYRARGGAIGSRRRRDGSSGCSGFWWWGAGSAGCGSSSKDRTDNGSSAAASAGSGDGGHASGQPDSGADGGSSGGSGDSGGTGDGGGSSGCSGGGGCGGGCGGS